VVQVWCDSDAREGRKNHSTMTSSKRRRHTPDQIIRKLAEFHKELDAGKEAMPPRGDGPNSRKTEGQLASTCT
jgi:hypothetical protein